NKHIRFISNQLENAKEKDAYYYIKKAELNSEELLNSDSLELKTIQDILIGIDSNIEYSYMCFKLDLYFKLIVLEMTEKKKIHNKKILNRILENVDLQINLIKKEHTILYIKYLSIKMLLGIKSDMNKYYSELYKYI